MDISGPIYDEQSLTPATLTWRSAPVFTMLHSNQESVLLCIVAIVTIFTYALELKTSCFGSKVDQLFILKVFIPFALGLIVLPLSWQRVNTWSWATWRHGQGEYLAGVLGDSCEILPSLFSGDTVKRFFLLWSVLAHKGDIHFLLLRVQLYRNCLL